MTNHQKTLLTLAADGNTNKKIAEKLGMPERTIKSHFTKIYKSLGASNRANAVAIGLRRGLIEWEVTQSPDKSA